MYGITETTIHVTYHLITIADLSNYTSSIIGCRIPDLQIYLFNQQQQPVPMGVAGEIYIGGALLEIDKQQLEAIGNYYIETVTAISTQPFERYESQCLLPAKEQHRLLIEWNDTTIAYNQNLSIHQQFEEQVTSNPEAIAVVFEGEQLSYQQLNCRANILAHNLRRIGVGADVPVAICVERSLEMMVGILGILKAGGAYLPLYPTYPQ